MSTTPNTQAHARSAANEQRMRELIAGQRRQMFDDFDAQRHRSGQELSARLAAGRARNRMLTERETEQMMREREANALQRLDLDQQRRFTAVQQDAAAAGLPTGARALAVYAGAILLTLLAAHFQPWAWF